MKKAALFVLVNLVLLGLYETALAIAGGIRGPSGIDYGYAFYTILLVPTHALACLIAAIPLFFARQKELGIGALITAPVLLLLGIPACFAAMMLETSLYSAS